MAAPPFVITFIFFNVFLRLAAVDYFGEISFPFVLTTLDYLLRLPSRNMYFTYGACQRNDCVGGQLQYSSAASAALKLSFLKQIRIAPSSPLAFPLFSLHIHCLSYPNCVRGQSTPLAFYRRITL